MERNSWLLPGRNVCPVAAYVAFSRVETRRIVFESHTQEGGQLVAAFLLQVEFWFWAQEKDPGGIWSDYVQALAGAAGFGHGRNEAGSEQAGRLGGTQVVGAPP